MVNMVITSPRDTASSAMNPSAYQDIAGYTTPSVTSKFSVLGSQGPDVEEGYKSLVGELYLIANDPNNSPDSKKTAQIYIKTRKFIEMVMTATFMAASRSEYGESLSSKLKVLKSLSVTAESKKNIQTGIAHMRAVHSLGKTAKLTEMVSIAPSNAANICLAALVPITYCLENIVQALLFDSCNSHGEKKDGESDSDSSCTTHSSSNEEVIAPSSANIWSYGPGSPVGNHMSVSWSPMIGNSPLRKNMGSENISPTFKNFISGEVFGSSLLNEEGSQTPPGFQQVKSEVFTPPHSPINTPPRASPVGPPARTHISLSPVARPAASPIAKGDSSATRSRIFASGLSLPPRPELKVNSRDVDLIFMEVTKTLSHNILSEDDIALGMSNSPYIPSVPSPSVLSGPRLSTPVILSDNFMPSPRPVIHNSPAMRTPRSPSSTRRQSLPTPKNSSLDIEKDIAIKKGQLCKYGLVNQCKYDTCWRSHSVEEVVKYNEYFRTHKCHKGMTGCKNGAACSYYHNEDQKLEADQFRLKYYGWTTDNPPANLPLPSPFAEQLPTPASRQ